MKRNNKKLLLNKIKNNGFYYSIFLYYFGYLFSCAICYRFSGSGRWIWKRCRRHFKYIVSWQIRMHLFLWINLIIFALYCRGGEMVDMPSWGGGARKGVGVRVSFTAQVRKELNVMAFNSFFFAIKDIRNHKKEKPPRKNLGGYNFFTEQKV